MLLHYFAFTIRLVERIGIAPIRLSACKANPGTLPEPHNRRTLLVQVVFAFTGLLPSHAYNVLRSVSIMRLLGATVN